MSEPPDRSTRGITTLLEMTSPDELQPAAQRALSLELEEIGPSDAALARETYVRIGAPLFWSGRMEWGDADWSDELSRSEVRAWIAWVDGGVAGLVELDSNPEGEVGIVVFGLVPEFIGVGLGGWFLTLATRLAWTVMADPVERVVVQTSSDDHPHALPNYRARGFRIAKQGFDHPSEEGTPP
jgi:GNAT superfamily N-acetyltransferase